MCLRSRLSFGFVCFSLIPVCISFYYAFTNYSLGSKTAAFIGFKNFLRLFQDEVFLKSLAITLKIRFDLCAAQADFRFAGGVPAHPAQPHGYVLPFTVLPAIPSWRQCGRCPGVETAVCPQRSVQQRAGQHGHEHHQLVRQPETGALPADFDVRLAVRLFDDYFCRWLKRNPCQLL